MTVRMRAIPTDYIGQDAPQKNWGMRDGKLMGRTELSTGRTTAVATLRADGTVQVRVERGPETLLTWQYDTKEKVDGSTS